MDNEMKPLIEVARETVRRDRHEYAETSVDYARGVVDGYEDGRAQKGECTPTFADLLTRASSADHALDLANQRIAELEAAMATQIKYSASLQRIVEGMCRGSLPEFDNTAPYHYALAQKHLAARPQVTGVVVDDAMVERMLAHNGERVLGSADFWLPRLTAALKSAQIVPLHSAEPVRWAKEVGGYHAGLFTTPFRSVESDQTIPLYRGVRDGE